LNFLGSRAELDPDEVDALFGVDTAAMEPAERLSAAEARLPDREAARAALETLIVDETTRLEALRGDCWHTHDGPKLAHEMELCTFDNSNDGALRRRYEMSNSLDFHRSLSQLSRRREELRKQRKREEQAAQTEPGWKEPMASEQPFVTREQLAAAAGIGLQPNAANAPLRNEPTASSLSDDRAGTSVESTDMTKVGSGGISGVPGRTESSAPEHVEGIGSDAPGSASDIQPPNSAPDEPPR
jgi:hypothetical protein